jgi:hypothetical protein
VTAVRFEWETLFLGLCLFVYLLITINTFYFEIINKVTHLLKFRIKYGFLLGFCG